MKYLLLIFLVLTSCIKEDHHSWICNQTVIYTTYQGEFIEQNVTPYNFPDLTHDEADQFIRSHTYSGDRGGYMVESKCQCNEKICQ
jgi:hypothetical protein